LRVSLFFAKYNTYGDPPNSDLLRRYGHVDDPNRFDVVEISIKTCVDVAQSHLSSQSPPMVSSEELQNRLDWALEMGIDELSNEPPQLSLAKKRVSQRKSDLMLTFLTILMGEKKSVFEVPTEVERKTTGSPLLPEELSCLLKIFMLSGEEFEDHKAKEKLPKPKLNNPDVITLAQKVIDRRMKDYPTSIDVSILDFACRTEERLAH
jgi:SET domain-containing protein 6